MKRCPGPCEQTKPTGEFYADTSHSDGLSSRCKACTLLKRDVYRSKNREKLKLQARVDRKRCPERGIWYAMIARCYDEQNEGYEYYGKRGISVCVRWLKSFDSFFEDMGRRPSTRHSIDRKVVNGNYELHNCRWATYTEQARNTRSNKNLTFRESTQCLSAWAEELGLPSGVLKDRLGKLGWDIEKAFFTPNRGGKTRVA